MLIVKLLLEEHDWLLVWAGSLLVCFYMGSAMWQESTTPKGKHDNPCIIVEPNVQPSASAETRIKPDPPTRTTKHHKQQCHTPRVVRFSCQPDELIPSDLVRCSLMSDNDKKQQWWRPKDFRKFKGSSHMLASELQTADSSHPTPFSYTCTILKVFLACQEASHDDLDRLPLSNVERRQLDQWMGTGTLRVGLEKLIVRSMAKGCTATRREVIHSVLEAQEMSQGDSEVIRRASLARSRPTRLFAAVIGHSLASSASSLQESMVDETSLPLSSPCQKLQKT